MKPSISDPLTQSAERAIADAAIRDQSDPLRSFRDRFVDVEPDVVYLDGNSLGRLPKATVERLTRLVTDEWGRELVRVGRRRALDRIAVQPAQLHPVAARKPFEDISVGRKLGNARSR